ncbi:hypothetical protein ADK67_27565 [Saccharothrix sp. NRRL B-16348]|nr:hypothetical protein ADK67_27565 [Saccharothrix sp. NRRL B-16348]
MQSPSKQSCTFALGGAGGGWLAELGVADVVVGGVEELDWASGVASVVAAGEVDDGEATRASPPQPVRRRGTVARTAAACRRMVRL